MLYTYFSIRFKPSNVEYLFSNINSVGFILNNNFLVNIVFYFNCYYSFLATKSATLIGQVVEILSYINTNTLDAFIPSQWMSIYASNTGYVPERDKVVNPLN